MNADMINAIAAAAAMAQAQASAWQQAQQAQQHGGGNHHAPNYASYQQQHNAQLYQPPVAIPPPTPMPAPVAMPAPAPPAPVAAAPSYPYVDPNAAYYQQAYPGDAYQQQAAVYQPPPAAYAYPQVPAGYVPPRKKPLVIAGKQATMVMFEYLVSTGIKPEFQEVPAGPEHPPQLILVVGQQVFGPEEIDPTNIKISRARLSYQFLSSVQPPLDLSQLAPLNLNAKPPKQQHVPGAPRIPKLLYQHGQQEEPESLLIALMASLSANDHRVAGCVKFSFRKPPGDDKTIMCQVRCALIGRELYNTLLRNDAILLGEHIDTVSDQPVELVGAEAMAVLKEAQKTVLTSRTPSLAVWHDTSVTVDQVMDAGGGYIVCTGRAPSKKGAKAIALAMLMPQLLPYCDTEEAMAQTVEFLRMRKEAVKAVKEVMFANAKALAAAQGQKQGAPVASVHAGGAKAEAAKGTATAANPAKRQRNA